MLRLCRGQKLAAALRYPEGAPENEPLTNPGEQTWCANPALPGTNQGGESHQTRSIRRIRRFSLCKGRAGPWLCWFLASRVVRAEPHHVSGRSHLPLAASCHPLLHAQPCCLLPLPCGVTFAFSSSSSTQGARTFSRHPSLAKRGRQTSLLPAECTKKEVGTQEQGSESRTPGLSRKMQYPTAFPKALGACISPLVKVWSCSRKICHRYSCSEALLTWKWCVAM